MLTESIAGELISSEIEIRSGRGEDAEDARARQADRRRRLFTLAAAHGVALGSTGTHPLSDYREQHIIDTEHYHRVEDGLKYVAWRNNTFSVHVHVGVRGADRAVLRLRPAAARAADAAGDLAPTRPTSTGWTPACTPRARQTFTKSFPRCGVPDAFGSWQAWADYVELLVRTQLDRRVHPAVVVRAPAPRLRHRRGAHLRRPDDRAGGRPARRADRRRACAAPPRRSTRGRRRPRCPAG